MENENIPQPLDELMTKLGLTNADLVRASTEQLSFKMVQKGRKGRRLTPNVQAKILTAFLAVKPALNLRPRDLFRYEMGQTAIEAIRNAMTQVRIKKINYPQFVELLSQAGITGYTIEVAPNRMTFFKTGSEAHIEQGPAISQDTPGSYHEDAIRSAIADAEKEVIDHAAFLKKIYEAGVVTCEVNCRSRKIEYKGLTQSYKDKILLLTPPVENVEPKIEEEKAEKKLEKKPKKKSAKNNKRNLSQKARHVAKKRLFGKRR